MKHYILLTFLLLLYFTGLEAQKKIKECGTSTPPKPLKIDKAKIAALRLAPSYPLTVKLFVYIIADTDGSNRAAEDTAVLRQMENMQQFYSSHNICFILAGMEQINSTDLNTMNTSEEQFKLAHYLLPDVMNVFIHSSLFDNDGSLNGISYGIPATRVSIVSSAIASTGNRSTLAHEIGHALGLYHTFETAYGQEKITRGDGVTGCSNCLYAGDLLCDTEADPHSDEYDTGNVIDEDCNYYGLEEQICDATEIKYKMDPTNIMAYGRRSCRDHFTPGQGERMRDMLVGTLDNLIAPVDQSITSNQTISSGKRFFLARNSVNVSASSFIVNNSAKVYLSAASIVFSEGATLTPSVGQVIAAINPLCQ